MARAEVDVLVITAPDRLARHFVHQMVVLEEWERAGIQVVFIDRPLSHDPHEQLVTQIRGAVAESERTPRGGTPAQTQLDRLAVCRHQAIIVPSLAG